MPLFRNELPAIGKQFIAIPEDGDGRNCDICIRVAHNDFIGSRQDNLGKSEMYAEYREWVYCETLPYFKQKEQHAENNQDKSHDYDELSWGADRANES
jgi:hypothetical protein